MNFEPQKFFIGLVDFFSILMPGALLTYLGKDWAAGELGLKNGYPLQGAEAGTVFLFASYLLGHFAFLLSSALDDLVYDRIRGWTDWGQICKRLANNKSLSVSWKRSLATSSWLFDKNADNAVIQAQRIKARALHGLAAGDAINAFQWCKARLTKDLPEGVLAVQRYEADSKFFRSFVVVLGVLAIFYLLRCEWPQAGICILGIAPALWRYIDQRFKATQQAYWFVITLDAGKTESPIYVTRADRLTHAGGIVCKGTGDTLKFLLTQADNDRAQWVLPKGHIEAGEGPRVTVVREVREETGYWARVVCWLEDGLLSNAEGAPLVRWFRLHIAEDAKEWPAEERQHIWLSPENAIEKATFPETKALLLKAHQHIKDEGALAAKK